MLPGMPTGDQENQTLRQPGNTCVLRRADMKRLYINNGNDRGFLWIAWLGRQLAHIDMVYSMAFHEDLCFTGCSQRLVKKEKGKNPFSHKKTYLGYEILQWSCVLWIACSSFSKHENMCVFQLFLATTNERWLLLCLRQYKWGISKAKSVCPTTIHRFYDEFSLTSAKIWGSCVKEIMQLITSATFTAILLLLGSRFKGFFSLGCASKVAPFLAKSSPKFTLFFEQLVEACVEAIVSSIWMFPGIWVPQMDGW